MGKGELYEKRIEWLNKVCTEARELGFCCLSELVKWVLENADKINVKSGD